MQVGHDKQYSGHCIYQDCLNKINRRFVFIKIDQTSNIEALYVARLPKQAT
ncbi:hypothetical protein [Mammaliicoccus sciuri]|uniref:hypothetical protein n=1 Tax=Mammaliicoccus sciuri TaxID=1296 RepID=UPI002DB7BB16|nr:hypothetical protein [Mammaliicoccus sciuri]MEB6198684.1 hypothetical protein [Mammaliicoccus sciuri]